MAHKKMTGPKRGQRAATNKKSKPKKKAKAKNMYS